MRVNHNQTMIDEENELTMIIICHLEAGLVCVGDDVLSTVGQAVTRQAQGHAEAAILLLKLLVGGTLVLRSL